MFCSSFTSEDSSGTVASEFVSAEMLSVIVPSFASVLILLPEMPKLVEAAGAFSTAFPTAVSSWSVLLSNEPVIPSRLLAKENSALTAVFE